MSKRYRILGLASVRASWFTDVSRWATSAVIPVEFVKCLSAEEVRARLSSGQQYSTLLADSSLPSLDRDLVAAARDAECAVVVIDDGRVQRDWERLGVAARLDKGFDPSALLDVLDSHARPVTTADDLPTDIGPVGSTDEWRGRLATVIGVAGSGVSTSSIALAQAMASDVRYAGAVLLVDCRLDGDQAVLHDTGDVVPGLQELVEAHRTGRPRRDEIRRLTYDVPGRGYEVLVGLRRHRDWAVLRERAFDAALDNLRRSYRLVVADADCDLEGQAECGSIEVEDRNLMARALTARADVLLVVARPTVVGLRRLATVIAEVLDHGVDPTVILPVLNQSPRNPAARAAAARVVAQLTTAARSRQSGKAAQAGQRPMLRSPLFLPERANIEDLHRDVAALPRQLATPLARAVLPLLDCDEQPASGAEPVPVAPGSLGHLTEAVT